MNKSKAGRLLERVRRMGVTFTEVGNKIGKSRSTVSLVLREEESDVTMNREERLEDIEDVLDDIEQESPGVP